MYNKYPRKTPDGQNKSSGLGQIISRHIEETVTDEQKQRVLSPIREKIYAGEFDRSPRRQSRILILVLAAGIMIIVMFVLI